MLERIVYVSRVAPGIGRAELYRIIRAAHARNRAAGLSGALVCLDGWFAQLLEGVAAPLGACFGRVLADPRHFEIELRVRERALCPLFPGQAMALRTRACLDERVLDGFDYRPGFPVEAMPSDLLVEFLVTACRRTVAPAGIFPAAG